jgi:soluble epoxide hydrolase / lipid-phosphate phosphatase
VKRVPNFRYQLRFSSTDCDRELDADPEQFFRRLLRPCNDGVGPLYDADKDTIIHGRPKVERSKAISEKQLKYYVDQYKKTGFHGPLNWYRTTKVRFEESKGKVQTSPNPFVTNRTSNANLFSLLSSRFKPDH